MLEFSVLNSFFLFDNGLYKQTGGVGMGLPLAPTLANIFLCFHETKWLNDCPPNSENYNLHLTVVWIFLRRGVSACKARECSSSHWHFQQWETAAQVTASGLPGSYLGAWLPVGYLSSRVLVEWSDFNVWEISQNSASLDEWRLFSLHPQPSRASHSKETSHFDVLWK